jgi:flagellin-like protein
MIAENDDTEAVSPVIGVILMVSITVILAAVIGTFVLGLGDNVEEQPSAGVTVEEKSQDTVRVSLINTGNLETFRLIGPTGEETLIAQDRTFLQTGVTYELSDNGFTDEELNNNFTVLGFKLPAAAYRECRIIHGKQVVEFGDREVPVGGADIPCTRTVGTGTPFDTLSTPPNFEYEEGRYKVLGAVRGKEQQEAVLRTFEINE